MFMLVLILNWHLGHFCCKPPQIIADFASGSHLFWRWCQGRVKSFDYLYVYMLLGYRCARLMHLIGAWCWDKLESLLAFQNENRLEKRAEMRSSRIKPLFEVREMCYRNLPFSTLRSSESFTSTFLLLRPPPELAWDDSRHGRDRNRPLFLCIILWTLE